MLKGYSGFSLVVLVILLCCMIPAQAKSMTYASDYYVLGNDLVNKGQYEDALTAYQTARSMDERFYNEHYGISYQIGWVLNKLGKYEEALEEFRIAEKYEPEWVAPFAIYYNEGCVLAKTGRNEEALKAFDSALLYGPTNWYVLYNKGIVLARMGRYSDAIAAFDKSRKSYGSYLPLLGSYQEVAATYAIAQGTSSPGNNIPAEALSDTGSPQSVTSETYDTETSVDQLMRTGMDFSARYEYENALVVFDRILKIDPGNYRAMSWRANTLAHLERYAEAGKMYDQSLLYLDYRVDEDYYIDGYYGNGWIFAKQGKYEDAIKSYAKVFIVDPDIFRAHYDKAWVLARQGKYDEAAREYNRSLDWENQERLETRSYSILGPLGTYREVSEAYNIAQRSPSLTPSLSVSPSVDVIYQTDFSTDPGWQTSASSLYYWDRKNKSYHFKSETSPGYAEIHVPFNGSPFTLEYDISIPHADPGALVRFGLAQYNTSENSQEQMVRYNTQNVILGEFKSWRATTYRSIKDGDKTFQIYGIDSRKFASDPEYEGMCRINREESITIPSFGDNRIYHVEIAFDPGAETISTRVTDNLHEKNYYVCTGLLSKAGVFHGLDRLILVAEPAENAYIEGSIDNVVLSVPAATGQTRASSLTKPIPTGVSGNSLPAVTTSSVMAPVALLTAVLAIVVVFCLFREAGSLGKGGQK